MIHPLSFLGPSCAPSCKLFCWSLFADACGFFQLLAVMPNVLFCWGGRSVMCIYSPSYQCGCGAGTLPLWLGTLRYHLAWAREGKPAALATFPRVASPRRSPVRPALSPEGSLPRPCVTRHAMSPCPRKHVACETTFTWLRIPPCSHQPSFPTVFMKFCPKRDLGLPSATQRAHGCLLTVCPVALLLTKVSARAPLPVGDSHRLSGS